MYLHSVDKLSRASTADAKDELKWRTAAADWASEQDSRSRLVDKVCRTHSNSNRRSNSDAGRTLTSLKGLCRDADRWTPTFSHLLVDVDHRVLYCSIPKTACTTVTLAIARMSANGVRMRDLLSAHVHHEKFEREHGIYRLNDYYRKIGAGDGERADAVRLKSLLGLKKFVVVRHPFERIVSAYVDKFVASKRDRILEKYGPRMKHRTKHRGKESASSDGGRYNVTFREFVRYLVDETVLCVEKFNNHWTRYVDFCHPCHIRYDYIVRYENFQREIGLVWDEVYRTGSVEERRNASKLFITRNASKVRSRDVLARYMAQLTSDEIVKLYRLYEIDFRMYGYTWPLRNASLS